MQLSMLSGCRVELKIYLEEDNSLLEYRSNKENGLDITKPLESYLNLQNTDYDDLSSNEMSITRTYRAGRALEQKAAGEIIQEISNKLEGFNQDKFFSVGSIIKKDAIVKKKS